MRLGSGFEDADAYRDLFFLRLLSGVCLSLLGGKSDSKFNLFSESIWRFRVARNVASLQLDTEALCSALAFVSGYWNVATRGLVKRFWRATAILQWTFQSDVASNQVVGLVTTIAAAVARTARETKTSFCSHVERRRLHPSTPPPQGRWQARRE